WRAVLAAMVDAMADLCDAWSWTPQEIDVGGGFATRRDPTARLDPAHADRPEAPPIEAYAELVATSVADELGRRGIDPAPITLEIEPGRSMFADAGLHLTTVRNVKREVPRAWVETDTTEMFLTDGVMEHNRFVPILADRADAPSTMRADLVGMSCQFDIIVP